MSLIRNKRIIELINEYRRIWALKRMLNLAEWDLAVYMPEKGSKARAEAMAKVEGLIQEAFLDKKFIKLLEKARKEKNLNDYEKGIIRVLSKSVDDYRKLPKELLEEFIKTTSEAHLIWVKAKKDNNFKLFEPYLEKIVALSRRKAKLLGYKKHPYDPLLNEFEEGLTTEETENYFNELKPKLIELIHYIKNSKNYKLEHKLHSEKYDKEKMKELNLKILNYLHGELNDLRLDLSAHPFTAGIAQGDARITTRYEGISFGNCYSSTIHEYGHALYELNGHEDLGFTPTFFASSLILHESQSRFWEKLIGTSKPFLSLFYKDMLKLSKNMKRYSIEEVYRYINLVKPSFIRVDADEVTYHLHIIIRFEIEKGLIEGSINVKDLPKIWNKKYKDYLGIEPKTDSLGVLQDVHWSSGLIGYFPTYSFGTALSLMWKHHMEKELGSLDKLMNNKKGVEKIKAWLKENIHQYGSTYRFRDLVRKSTGENFTPDYLVKYLNEKYRRIY